MIWDVPCELLDGGIEIKEHGTSAVIAHHTLNPEKCRKSRSASDWHHAVQAAGGIKNKVTGRKLDAVHAISIFHDEFAPVVVTGRVQKQCRGDIRADAVGAVARLPYRVVDVIADVSPVS